MKKRFLLALSFCLIAAMLIAGTSSAAPAPKVDVCHLDDMGNYIKINISENAFDAHVAHGDASPGMSIPEKAGWAFDENCVAYELAFESMVIHALKYANHTTSTLVLEAGKKYKLEAIGTYTYWPSAGSGAGIADAKYSLRPPGSYNNTGGAAWIDGTLAFPSNLTYALQVVYYEDDYNLPLKPVGWDENFNMAHVYTKVVDGDGQTISLYLWDDNYTDNSGSITVNIYELPQFP